MAVKPTSRVAARGDVFLVELDPTRGSEIHKTRPCLIVSPDELNQHLRTVIIAPMTTAGHAYPFRPVCRFGGKDGRVALDQLRTVDVDRLRKRLGVLSTAALSRVFNTLHEMFDYQTPSA
jgi:mRNA interferase MazF